MVVKLWNGYNLWYIDVGNTEDFVQVWYSAKQRWNLVNELKRPEILLNIRESLDFNVPCTVCNVNKVNHD